MLFLAKLAGILVMVWFYLTGKKQGENAIKWAIIGLIGFWIAWWLAKTFIISALVGFFAKNSTMSLLMTQIPAICGVAMAFFVRKKLIKDVEKAKLSE